MKNKELISKFKTKAIRGIEYGDVSNSAIRNILTVVSRESFHKITEQELLDTYNYFDGRCPYTNKKLIECTEVAIDHIVPINKDECGLNVYGNVVIVEKIANSKKNKMNIDDFMLKHPYINVDLKTRKTRLKKIKEFQKSCGYKPDEIKLKIHPILEEYYSSTTNIQKERIDTIKLALK